jgi:hypothetical protein
MPANKYPRAADPKQGICIQETARAHPCGLLLRHPTPPSGTAPICFVSTVMLKFTSGETDYFEYFLDR